MIYQQRILPAKNIQDVLRGGLRQAKTIIAAAIAPSGRGVSIELDGDGEVAASDMDLIKRIAATVKLSDEPALIDSGEVSLDNGIHLPIPADFSAVKSDDPLDMRRVMRARNTSSPMRSITALPIVLLPKDGAATLQTMMSVFGNGFADAEVQADASGDFRIEPDVELRRLLPLRAYATAKRGLGIIVIFRGGEDDAWIDEAWQAMHDKIAFPDDSNVDDLIANGSTAARQLADKGLAPLLPEISDDLWWKLCIGPSQHACGWLKYTPGANAGRFEQRLQVEDELQEMSYDWRGSADLKSYRAKTTVSFSDVRDKESPQKEVRDFVASLKGGKNRSHSEERCQAYQPPRAGQLHPRRLACDDPVAACRSADDRPRGFVRGLCLRAAA